MAQKWKSLSNLLRGSEYNNDNLHRIAISNLRDHERRVVRWWCKKYRTPEKPFGDHTMEELVLEMLEDYYDQNPQEIDRFLDQQTAIQEVGWDGRMSDDYEIEMQKRLKKLNNKNKIDVSKYVSQETLTEEEEKRILDSLGMNLPKSRVVTNKQIADKVEEVPTVLGEEFEDTF